MKRKGERAWVLGYLGCDEHWHPVSLYETRKKARAERDRANEHERNYPVTRLRWSVRKYVPAEGRG